MKKASKLMTISQAAAFCGKPYYAVYAAAKNGVLEHVVVEGTIYCTERMLNEWLDNNVPHTRRKFNEKMRKATTIIPEWCYNRIDEMAKESNTSIAKIICDVLEMYMQEEESNG